MSNAKIQDFEVVCVIEDDGSLVVNDGVTNSVNYERAYQLFRTSHGDLYDQITFFLDTHSGMPSDGPYFSQIYNNVLGIGLEQRDTRSRWGTTKLQGYHVMAQWAFQTWRHTMGQEWGHQFAAFAHYRNPSTGPALGEEMDDHINSQYPGHWSSFLDDDSSPMAYDRFSWIEVEPGRFRIIVRPIEDMTYSDLDLYLMGLKGPEDVGDFFILRNPNRIDDYNWTATKVVLTIQDFINHEGVRIPSVSNSPKHWRQAFIVLTKDINMVRDFAGTVNFQRLKWERDFPIMTKGRGLIVTSLDKTTDTTSSTGPANMLDISNLEISLLQKIGEWGKMKVGGPGGWLIVINVPKNGPKGPVMQIISTELAKKQGYDVESIKKINKEIIAMNKVNINNIKKLAKLCRIKMV